MTKKQSPIKPKAVSIPNNPNALKKLEISLGLIIAVFAFLLYVQSISFDYVVDDGATITSNKFVIQGIAGIPTILKTDYWFGISENMRGPVYRPIPLIIFAFEWQFFPNNPHFAHFINILMYALTCWVLFLLLCTLFRQHSQNYSVLFAFICALLYTAHPIHTEVVDYIKSLDEILCFLFGLLAVFFSIKFIERNSYSMLIISLLCFFFSLLSKETGISFVLLIPLLLFAFIKIEFKKIALISSTLFVITGLFFLIRYKVFESLPVNTIMASPLNNSLIATHDILTQKAAAFYVLLLYLLLLIFPNPLSYDYSFAQIPLQSLGSPLVLISFLIYGGAGIYSLITIRKKSIIATGMLIYLVTLVPVSNILLLIGSPMAERFLFMPSLGFTFLLTFVMMKWTKTDLIKTKYTAISQMISSNKKLFTIVFIIVGLYSIKTISRTADWKDNATLFGHDVMIADNSARAHYNYGTVLLHDLLPKEKIAENQHAILENAISEFSKAVSIYPEYPVAWYNLAKAHIDSKQFDKAVNALDSAIKYDPNYLDAYSNKGYALTNSGRYDEAISAFQKVVELNPKDADGLINLASMYGMQKNYSKAVEYFKKACEINPDDIEFIRNIGATYLNMGDTLKAKEYLEKANKAKASQQK